MEDVLNKYAEAAVTLMEEKYGDYTEDEVVKLADALIRIDMEREESFEKVAEWDSEGRILARAFNDELQKIASNPLYVARGITSGRGATQGYAPISKQLDRIVDKLRRLYAETGAMSERAYRATRSAGERAYGATRRQSRYAIPAAAGAGGGGYMIGRRSTD